MKNLNLTSQENRITFVMIVLLIFIIKGFGQTDASDILKLVKAHPDSLELHQEYIMDAELSEKELITTYKNLIEKYPQNATIPFAIGEALWRKELPEAKPFLLNAVELDPKLAKAYFYLWIDGERWGEFEKSRAFIKKAAEIEPNNPDYAFYYAGTFSKSDKAKYTKLSLQVAEKFPDSERGAQSLYWLAYRSNSTKDKLHYFKLLKEKFPPNKFSWSTSGMSGYSDLLLKSEPSKSVELAKDMLTSVESEREQKYWKNQLDVAKGVNKVNELLASDKPEEAIAVVKKIKLPRWSKAKNSILLLKAKAFDMAGETEAAYKELKNAFATMPETELKSSLYKYGAKIYKSEKDINRDIWAIRDTLTKPATNFSLKRYFKPGKASLSDYQGKVILLTYWFPGCGPCRGEFPHFQNVVDKFEEKDLVYLGINIAPEQNDYVIPFMKSSGYSFIPLEDYKDREKGNLDNRGAAPVNFLIDKKGNIVYSKFRTDGSNEGVLEAMITSLLERN